MRHELHGIISALLISYNPDGSFDEQGTRSIIRHNIDNMHVDGLYVGGSTGENFMIPTEMKKRIFEVVKEEVNGAVKLIAQVGSVNLLEAVELAKFVQELGGYQAISAVTPFYYKFSFQEVKDYYFTIVEACELPLIIYSIPFLTGVNLSLDQFGELFAHPRIIGVKFTAADFYLLERLRYTYPDVLVFSGFDEMLLPALCYKVDGCIGSTFNVDARIARRLWNAFESGDTASALIYQNQMNNFITDVLSNGLYQTLKECLRLQGVKASLHVRPPMHQSSPEQIRRSVEIFDRSKKYLEEK